MAYFCNVYIKTILVFCLVCCCFQGWVQQPAEVGQPAPDLMARTISGDTVSLRSYKGDIVLVDFWASWNTASRRNNLSTKKIYEKYRAISLRKKRKFHVVQISLDTRPDLLKIAISKDNLYWRTHICDYKGWHSPYTSFFNLHRIPANFLIDTAGIIVARDVWEDALDHKLKGLME
jgi:peroxiredoxin